MRALSRRLVPRSDTTRKGCLPKPATIKKFPRKALAGQVFQPATARCSGLRRALRQQRNSPGFTPIATGTPAPCIGVNTAVFRVVDATLPHRRAARSL
jgi:hypothetical protein